MECREGAVELVIDKLTAMHIEKKDRTAVRKIITQKKPFHNLREFFFCLNKRWNFLEYHTLKELILQTCSGKLKQQVKAYVEDVQNFQRNTTIAEFIKYRRYLAKEKRIPDSYIRFKTEHKIKPDSYTLADLEKLRKKTSDHVKLSDFALQVHTITANCIIVEWMIPEEIVEILSLFYSSEVGQELLRDHHIENIFVDDKSLHSVSIHGTHIIYQCIGAIIICSSHNFAFLITHYYNSTLSVLNRHYRE